MLIVEPGYTWVTDLGRFAGASLGLSVNGALDQFSASVANVLVANHRNATLLEVLRSGLTFVAEENLLVSVTGARCTVRIDGAYAPMWLPVSVRQGQTVRLAVGHTGLRTYLAVRGGFDVPRLLGSCAPDSMLGFGTQLGAGDRLAGPIETPALRNAYFDLPLIRLMIDRHRGYASGSVDVTDGPDYGEFGDSAELLYTTSYEVSSRSNHVGLRLTGDLPRRRTGGEVLSRGVPVGAIEVPSREGLLLLHRGRGVTAGYPVLAVVTGAGLDVVAQAQPGKHLRFRRVTITEARNAALEHHLHIEELAATCRDLLAAHGIDTDHEALSRHLVA